MTVLWSAAAFLLTLGILVNFHEFGHFWTARKLKVKVVRFSFGFGKPFWSYTAKDGVEYAIAPIPLGGYVKFAEADEKDGAKDSLEQQPVWKRILIVGAGPFANFLLAVLLYWLAFMVGIPDRAPLISVQPNTPAAVAGLQNQDRVIELNGQAVVGWSRLQITLIDEAVTHRPLNFTIERQGQRRTVQVSTDKVRAEPSLLLRDLGVSPYMPPIPAVLAEITPNSPASKAGFKVGDELLTFSHQGQQPSTPQPVQDWESLRTYIMAHGGEVLKIDLRRNGQVQTLSVLLGQHPKNPQWGYLGAGAQPSTAPVETVIERYGLFEGAWEGVKKTYQTSLLTLKLLGKMLVGEVSLKNIGGPVQTAEVAGVAASIGLIQFIEFLAFFSVSIGVMNLLPIPMLDGGHLLFYVAEAIRGKPLPPKVLAWGQSLGITALMLLMGLAFYNDILRLVG